MIKAIQIQKSYGPLQVLKGVDLQVEKGELVSIVGASGAGKSTLLHIIGTLDKPDAGEVIMNDIRLSGLNEKELAHFRNKHIGFVFQFHHLLPEFDLKENISMPGYIGGWSKKDMDDRANTLIQYFGLQANINKKPSQLSGGEQQRAAICRALFSHPSVILADEPTGNLDQSNAEEFHRLIRQLSTDFNQTFVIVTHQPDLADQCDKILTLENGSLHLRS